MFIFKISVKNLYTNITITDSIQILKNNIENTNKMNIEKLEGLVKLLTIALHLNCFKFENAHCIQTKGLAMGSLLSSIKDEMFLSHIENKYIMDATNTFFNQINFHYRYIDDTLCLFPGTKRYIESFKSYLHKTHPCLKLTSYNRK